VEVKIAGGEEQFDFTWNTPQIPGVSSSDEQLTEPLPEPEHFTIHYGPDYEVIFIEEIIGTDEDIVEIGVFVEDTCFGATVFQDEYPVSILAHTVACERRQYLSLELYTSDDTYLRYDKVLVRDPETREYSRQQISPMENKFTFIKLYRTDDGRGLSVEDEEDIVKPEVMLSQNYPNPFNNKGQSKYRSGGTNIFFYLPESMEARLNIYNIKDQLVRTLLSGEKINEGEHNVTWDGRDDNNRTVGSGIYFYRLETPEKTVTKKMLIVR